MIPKCSFTLKPKIRKITKQQLTTHSLGDYIRNERLKRDIQQDKDIPII